jgi:diguanylate cyclase (GGDEF)-like protein/PAS domain S-box-containing protein
VYFNFAGLCFTDAGGIEFHHDLRLVALSYLIAAAGSYAALEMIERWRNARRDGAVYWQLGCASVLGGTIWSMHFVGMLALEIGLPMTYAAASTLLSLLIAILGVGLGLQIIRAKVSSARVCLAGITVGLGVGAMHYIGMAGIRFSGNLAYEPSLWSLSLLVGIAAATAALWLSLTVRGMWQRVVAALIMGGAICGMHYTGMAATVFHVDPLAEFTLGLPNGPLAAAAGTTTLVLIVCALVFVAANRRVTTSATHDGDGAPPGWSFSGRFASLGLLTVLVGLLGFALFSAIATYRTGIEVTRATELKEAFGDARYSVGSEESLERKYRLDPSKEVRAGHRAAAEALVSALKKGALVGDAADRHLIDDVLARHQQYLRAIDRMFAAADNGDKTTVETIDLNEADPAFDVVEARVDAAANRHRLDATDQLRGLAIIQTRVLIATPIVFALGVLLVMFFWRAYRVYQWQAEKSLIREASAAQSSERRLYGLVQNASDMILICAAPGTVIYQSPAAETMWGYPAADLLGEPVMTLVHPDDQPALIEHWNQLRQAIPGAINGADRTVGLRFRNGSGNWRDAEFIGTNLLHDTAVQGIVVTVRDVTERKAFEQQLIQQAFYDGLTELPNRVLFRDRLEQAFVRASRHRDAIGLLFLDLDNFKLVNDSLGHDVGDKLLTEAAARLRSCVRAQDTVARLGGDEFVVVLELLTGEADALTVADAIAEEFSRPFLLAGREIVVTASVGIAIGAAGYEQADSLLRNADVAMYRAKSEGRGRYVVFEPSMHLDAVARLNLETELRRAIDHQELRVHYQPVVVMGTGQVNEVEALVRWQHPTRGLVSPDEFIAVAEETGLIIPLGKWVLETACRQVADWHKRVPGQPPLTLSVNLSPRQFQKPTLVADIALALSEAGLAPECLKLEVTEGVLMRNVEATIQTLWRLKALGVRIAIDDFGTGYSSLSYLKRLPLDVLKIDRSFVNGIGHDLEDTAIVRAIMAMAKSLGLKVTGEGVETAEQAAMLDAWGCDLGQGFYFGKPLDGEQTGVVLGIAAERAPAASLPSEVSLLVN